MKRTALLAAVVAGSGFDRCPPARRAAFDSKGHDVIEALAYRTLVEGHADQPPAPEVLRDLFNDGALAPPICFGDAASRTAACRTASVDNPLLEWPEPRTDRPDAAFRRQFSDPGPVLPFHGDARGRGLRSPGGQPHPSRARDDPTTYGGSLQLGLRDTSADSRYLIGVLGSEFRWYRQ